MDQEIKPSNASPVGVPNEESDVVVNDSLGTVDLSDSSGNDAEEATEDRSPKYERKAGQV
jgi:hypothetical protein